MRQIMRLISGIVTNEKGHTLSELMVVVALLPILTMSIYSSLTMANVIFRTNNTYGAMNQSAMQTLRYISREMGQSSPNSSPNHFTISANGTNNTVRFQIPVDWDNDGDVITSANNPAVEWGIYDEANQKTNGRLNGWARYSLSNNQLIREVLDSSLSPVSGLSRVVANNVQAFTVSKSSNNVTMSITLQATDGVGQAGQTRTLQTSFNSRTMLRNAVN